MLSPVSELPLEEENCMMWPWKEWQSLQHTLSGPQTERSRGQLGSAQHAPGVLIDGLVCITIGTEGENWKTPPITHSHLFQDTLSKMTMTQRFSPLKHLSFSRSLALGWDPVEIKIFHLSLSPNMKLHPDNSTSEVISTAIQAPPQGL